MDRQVEVARLAPVSLGADGTVETRTVVGGPFRVRLGSLW